MAIEEEFSIEIPDKDADAIHSGGWPFFSLYGLLFGGGRGGIGITGFL
jgi:hypothetical protein